MIQHDNPLSNTPFTPGVQAPAAIDAASALVLCGQDVLVAEEGVLPLHDKAVLQATTLPVAAEYFIGHWHAQPCFVIDAPTATPAPPGLAWRPLRSLFNYTETLMFPLLATAKQVVQWGRDHRFCGRCGTPTQPHARERAMCCPGCGHRQYPRLSPCIIVLVTRGDEVLLARSPHFKAGVYSTLAGFIEPGESAEQALHREVMEEVGIEVKNLRYLASQSWPFPHSLMLGFHAEYAGGEIQVDGVEIEDARWWHLDRLPAAPSRYAISYYLLEQYISARRMACE